MAIVDRVKAICLKPKEEWDVIAGETTSAADLLKSYALPLAAIGAVASFIGASFIGFSVPFIGTIRAPVASGLIGAAAHLALMLVAVYLLGIIIAALAPQFGAEKNQAQALKVAVYSFTPGWVAGVLRIIPSLGILGLVAMAYGIYVMHLGLQQLMKPAKEKAATYTVVVVLCGVGLMIVLGLVVGAITAPAMLAAPGLR